MHLKVLSLLVASVFLLIDGHAGTSKRSFNIFTTDTNIVQQYAAIPGDFPDPSIIRHNDIYYAAGTSSEWAPNYPLFISTDLRHWQQSGYIFRQTPAWASSSFWAPELFYWHNTYYVYYAARRKADNISCIGVATSTDPAKGFTDKGIILEFGKEAIDAFVTEDSGKLYMSFKAYGLDNRPIEILAYRLTDDGLHIQGEPFSLLRDDNREGLEGQCIIKRNNYFYFFYSMGNCCGRECSYRANVARATSFKGPYEKYENNPVLTEAGYWKCTGHGTVVSDAQGNDHYLYHAYNKQSFVYTGRQGMMANIVWNRQTGWPVIEPVNGVNPEGFTDDFKSPELSPHWQWDMRHTQPVTQIKNNVLYLSGKTTDNNKTGTALTVRPYTANYSISTLIVNNNTALKGLVVYGDAAQSIGIGIKNNTLLVWQVKDTVKKIWYETALPVLQNIYLKMEITGGSKIKCYWSKKAGAWTEVKMQEDYITDEDLSQWDRSPRPGILQDGATAEPAAFKYFRIEYR